MAVLAFSVLILAAMTGLSSGGSWCICKDGLSEAALQKTLDYACGAGADCTQIHSSGACYQPNTVRAHCSYAVNSYFQKKGQAQGSCDFSGTASTASSDPSYTGCAYPASASFIITMHIWSGADVFGFCVPKKHAAASTTPISTSTTPSTSTSTSTTPYSGTPTVYGGIGSGLGPSGNNMDDSDGGISQQGSYSLLGFFTTLIMFSCFCNLW